MRGGVGEKAADPRVRDNDNRLGGSWPGCCWHALKEFALAVLKTVPHPSDENLSKLASITKESVGDAGEFVRSIAAMSPKLDTVATPKKWAYLILKKLFQKKSQVADPFGVVEHIYADFDYPEELEGFVRWMPATEPVATPEGGTAKMYQKWQQYLSPVRCSLVQVLAGNRKWLRRGLSMNTSGVGAESILESEAY